MGSVHPEFQYSSVVALLLSCCALSSRASKIDDFEAGAFDLSTNSTTNGAQGALNPIHCIAARRLDTTWDGRDARGVPVAAGICYVRAAEGAGPPAMAKVVKVE